MRQFLTTIACVIAVAGCDRHSLIDQAEAADLANPCSLLTVSEISAVVAGAKPAMRDETREKYGISACEWKTARGRIGIETYKSPPNAVEDDIRGLAEGFVDPLRPGVKNNIRFEKIEGVGEKAMAIVETEDQKRGILTTVAMLVTQRGDTVLIVGSDELARMDRAKALAGLQKLGAAAAKRL